MLYVLYINKENEFYAKLHLKKPKDRKIKLEILWKIDYLEDVLLHSFKELATECIIFTHMLNGLLFCFSMEYSVSSKRQREERTEKNSNTDNVHFSR